MNTPPVEQHWSELSDLTIHEAAFWMVTGSDPTEHEMRCGQDDAYGRHYRDHPGGAESVEKKCEVIFSAIRCGLIKTTEDAQPKNDGSTKRTRILKADWISWCLDNGYPEIANRFGHRREGKDSIAVNAPKVPRKIPPISEDWTVLARSIADECFDHDTNANPPVRDSLATKNSAGHITGGYCFRVMVIMQERGIKGPRGIYTNPGTVMRDALQGKKWWANKDK